MLTRNHRLGGGGAKAARRSAPVAPRALLSTDTVREGSDSPLCWRNLDVYVRAVGVRVLFLESSLVRVGMGVYDTVVGVLVLVYGVLVFVIGVGMLVHGVLVLVRMDVYPTAVVLCHPAPFVKLDIC